MGQAGRAASELSRATGPIAHENSIAPALAFAVAPTQPARRLQIGQKSDAEALPTEPAGLADCHDGELGSGPACAWVADTTTRFARATSNAIAICTPTRPARGRHLGRDCQRARVHCIRIRARSSQGSVNPYQSLLRSARKSRPGVNSPPAAPNASRLLLWPRGTGADYADCSPRRYWFTMLSSAAKQASRRVPIAPALALRRGDGSGRSANPRPGRKRAPRACR